MVKWIKQIIDKSKLVWNNPVNLHQTKLDKSKLAYNNPVKFPSDKTRQVQTCLIQSCQFASYNITISQHGEITEIYQTNARQV